MFHRRILRGLRYVFATVIAAAVPTGGAYAMEHIMSLVTNSWRPIDNVHFTVTSNQRVAAGSPAEICVWAHFDHHREEVIRRAREYVLHDDLRTRTKGPVAVFRGTTIDVRLDIPDVIEKALVDTVLWDGEIANAVFVVEIAKTVVLGRRRAIAEFYVDGMRIADVAFVVEVDAVETGKLSQVTAVGHYKRAFASYASEDRDAVLARLQGIHKILSSLDVFLDVVSLRSGDNWEKRLWDVIPINDVFYLFWSEGARRSVWVEREWRCALKSRGIDFIEPVPLVDPRKVPQPAELSSKHFYDWHLAYISESTIKSCPTDQSTPM